MRVVEAPAAASPWFRVVSVTEMMVPAAALVGAKSSDTMRSGRGVIVIDLIHVLLVSSDSSTFFGSSATTIR